MFTTLDIYSISRTYSYIHLSTYFSIAFSVFVCKRLIMFNVDTTRQIYILIIEHVVDGAKCLLHGATRLPTDIDLLGFFCSG